MKKSLPPRPIGNTYVDAYEAHLGRPQVIGNDIRVNFTGVFYISPDPNPLVREQHFREGQIVFRNVQEYRFEVSPASHGADAGKGVDRESVIDKRRDHANSLYPLQYLHARCIDEAGKREIMTYVRCESIVLSGKLATTDEQYKSLGPDAVVTCDFADLDKLED